MRFKSFKVYVLKFKNRTIMQSQGSNDLGIELLMNPNKRMSTGNVSVVSSKAASIRDIKIDSASDDEISVKEVKKYAKVSRAKSVSSSSGSSSSRLSSSSSSDDTSTVSSFSTISSSKTKKYSHDEILNLKRELLYQFDRLEKKGFKIPKKFSMASSLEEMKHEYERMKRDREVDISVKFQKKMLMTIVSGVEFLNDRFDPFDIKLDGWSESVSETINNTDYDDIFEELYDKYKGKAKMPPELKLLLALGGSAFTFHLTNTMFKSSLPGLDQVMKQNPDLMRQFTSATVNMMGNNQQQQQQPKSSSGSGAGGLMGGLSGIIGSLFGGGGGGGSAVPRPSAEPGMRPQMRGPSNVDDILKELSQQTGVNANDRIETMSTISESELSDIPDDASVASAMRRKSTKGRGRTLNI